MKILSIFLDAIKYAYSPDVSPRLFGSKDRIKAKKKIAEGFEAQASATKEEISQVRARNPYESAAAKLAMAEASRNAQLMQKRTLNTLGAGATPEAIIAAQQASSEGVGAAAGQIAAGAEANQLAEINALRGIQLNQNTQAANMRNAAADQIGSGWASAFQAIEALGSLSSGVGGAAAGFAKKVAGTGNGG